MTQINNQQNTTVYHTLMVVTMTIKDKITGRYYRNCMSPQIP